MTQRYTPPAPDRPLLRDWLRRKRAAVDAVVLDIDGVLARNRRSLPGAPELLAALDEMDLPFNLLTNDASNSAEEKAAYLASAGLAVRSDRICSSGHALRWLAEERSLEGAVFCVLGRLGVPDYAEAAGFTVTRDLDILETPACRGLIVGEKEYDWETAVNAAVNHLIRRPEGLLVCPNPDLYFPGRDGRIRLSSGAVAHLIRDMTLSYGRPCAPIYLGKPYRPLFARNHALLERRKGGPLQPGRVLMVGDSLTGDIAGGAAFGYRTAVVLTGLTTQAVLAGATPAPEVVLGGL